MVRKRSKGARRHYESEDEPETESDFEDDPVYEPAPKKYSLRQRKRTTFTSDDWDIDDDAPVPPVAAPKVPSEDEDFDVQNEPNEVHEPNEPKVDEAADSEYVDASTYINTVEPTAEGATAENEEELVDFEDMIRADIVVNKNRIDYDNVIQKTEIKVQPLPEGERVEAPKKKTTKQQPLFKPKGKRGRRPKRRNSELEEPQYFAPQIQEDENDEDYHPYKPKRTRKPKKRPAGEIDSSLLDDFDPEDDCEDQNDIDYNPEDDLDYPDISNFILNKQISDDIEDSTHSIVTNTEAAVAESTAEPNSSVDATTADTTDSTTITDSIITPEGAEAPNTTAMDSNTTIISDSATISETAPSDSSTAPSDSKATPASFDDVAVADTTSIDSVPDTTETIQPENIASDTEPSTNIDGVDVPVEIQEDNEAEKGSILEKVSSTSHESVIKVNENCVTSDVQVNGSVKHIEDPNAITVNIDDDDDDIVFVEEDKKYEIIVLDD